MFFDVKLMKNIELFLVLRFFIFVLDIWRQIKDKTAAVLQGGFGQGLEQRGLFGRYFVIKFRRKNIHVRRKMEMSELRD